MTLPMFPTGFPDEYFSSIIGRYHLMKVNRTDRDTFRELFNSVPFKLGQWIPQHLEEFTESIACPSLVERLLERHTLLPLLRIFCGFDFQFFPDSPQPPKPIGRVPRRSLGNASATQICERCVRDDSDEFGMPFFHLSHQVPGVMVCHKHGTRLLTACPICHCPFDELSKLTLVPWESCGSCHYRLGSKISGVTDGVSAVEHDFSKFCRDLLKSKLAAVSETTLGDVYWKKISELGITRKTVVDRISLTALIEEHYGSEMLTKVDHAYRTNRTFFWVRTGSTGMHNYPMTRHLLTANFVFGDSAQFLRQIEAQQGVEHTERPDHAQDKNTQEKKLVQATGASRRFDRDVHEDTAKTEKRAELLALLMHKKPWPIPLLWQKKRSLMKFLVQNDREWFDALLTGVKTDGIPADVKADLCLKQQMKDDMLAKRITEKLMAFYASKAKPVKGTKSCLLRMTEGSADVFKTSNYPKTAATILKFSESNWHFYARRLLWCLNEFADTGITSTSALLMVAGLEYRRGLRLIKYFLEKNCLRTDILETSSIAEILKKQGIRRDWEGPQPWDSFGPPVGRAYIPKSRRGVAENNAEKHV